MTSFYDLKIKTPSGKSITMSDYKGRIMLIVNTATHCRLTPQFAGLENLHQKFKDDGLVLIGFPCNQFNRQEPETNTTMIDVCLKNYGVTFQLTEKINVNGPKSHPVFTYLKKQKWSFLTREIKWNFTKFLIDQNGNVLKRYSPITSPHHIGKDIDRLLTSSQ